MTFEIYGKTALFSDPLTQASGEKTTYPVPTYSALVGICSSIYWKPSIVWVIDQVRVMNQIRTESEATTIRRWKSTTGDIASNVYLQDVRYQVKAHFEFSDNSLYKDDHNVGKHTDIARRSLEAGGRLPIMLGVSECQGFVQPCEFGSGEGFYDHAGKEYYGVMFHSFKYADEDGVINKNKMVTGTRFFQCVMEDGIVTFPHPDECSIGKDHETGACYSKTEALEYDRKRLQWYQGLLHSYDVMEQRGLVGVKQPGKRPLVPLGHALSQATYEITIDADGNFLHAKELAQDEKATLMPGNEKAMARSSDISPFALHDQVKYVAGDFATTEKERRYHQAYLEELSGWAEAEDLLELQALLTYINKSTVMADLTDSGIENIGEKAIVRFAIDDGDPTPVTYRKAVQDSFIRYYLSGKTEKTLSYGTGQIGFFLDGTKHGKNMIPEQAQAKLISGADIDGFTYRGRFVDMNHAMSLDLESSQKVHAMLRWLVQNHSYNISTDNVANKFLIWEENGCPIPSPLAITDVDGSMEQELEAIPDDAAIHAMTVTAIMPGRLSVGFYVNLTGSEYKNRVRSLADTYRWRYTWRRTWVDKKPQVTKTPYEGMVSIRDLIYQIIQTAEHMKVGPTLQKKALEQLFMGTTPVFSDEYRYALEKMGIRAILKGNDITHINCMELSAMLFAVSEKTRKGRKWESVLDLEEKDRSYLYGRLLATAKKMESVALWQEGKDRDTNADRLFEQYLECPNQTWANLYGRLQPYITKHNLSYYEGVIEQILGNFSMKDFMANTRLESSYILGYTQQMAEFENRSRKLKAEREEQSEETSTQ